MGRVERGIRIASETYTAAPVPGSEWPLLAIRTTLSGSRVRCNSPKVSGVSAVARSASARAVKSSALTARAYS